MSLSFVVNDVLYTIAVNGQECTDTDTVGSLSHDNNIVHPAVRTFILAAYEVSCSGTVVAWQFCYQRNGVTSVTFYPGIWTPQIMDTNTDYTLVQSTTVTYDQSERDAQDITNEFPCQVFNLSDTDQFTAPAGSVVGLYATLATQLLHTNTDSSITTYRFNGNQSSVTTNGNVNYNIAIRVHLGKNYNQVN